MHRSSVLIAVTLMISQVTLASDEAPRYDVPQPAHELLKRLAGDWRFERQSVPAEGSAPTTLGTGTISAEMLGDFFVVSRWSGDVYGADYHAFQALGFDIEQEKYTGTWIDSWIGYRWELSGTVDEESQELTMTTRGPGPTGGTADFRERYQFASADSITILGEMERGDKWVPITTTRLTRER